MLAGGAVDDGVAGVVDNGGVGAEGDDAVDADADADAAAADGPGDSELAGSDLTLSELRRVLQTVVRFRDQHLPRRPHLHRPLRRLLELN